MLKSSRGSVFLVGMFLLVTPWLSANPEPYRLKFDSLFQSQIPAEVWKSLPQPTLVIPQLDMPIALLANQIPISEWGDTQTTTRLFVHRTVTLPPALLALAKDGPVMIELRPLVTTVHQRPLGKVELMDRRDALSTVFWRNFFGTQLLTGIALSALLLGLFSFLLWFKRRQRDNRPYLSFAFMNLFFVLAYFNNIFAWDAAPTLLLEKISKTSMPLWTLAFLWLILDYTQLFRQRRFLALGASALFLPGLFLVLSATDVPQLLVWHGQILVPAMLIVDLFVLGCAVAQLVRQRNSRNLLLVSVILVAVAASMYDGWTFTILRVKPDVMLLPYASFAINLFLLWIIAYDLTKAYQLADDKTRELESLASHLEETVVERTRELALENRAKDTFLSILSHDMKNSLAGVMKMSEFLRSEEMAFTPEERAQALELVSESAVKSYNLLEGLLAWSKSRSEVMRPQFSSVPMRHLIQNVVHLFSENAAKKDIRLLVDCEPSLVWECDQAMTETIVRNLVSNALKFTPKGGQVTIACSQKLSVCALEVIDTGIGMSDQAAATLFNLDKPYRRKGTDQEEGSGLGLYLAKELADRQGFVLSVRSSLTEGTRFRLEWPSKRG